MGSRPSNAKQLRKALARITNDQGSRRDETIIFRVEPTSADGKWCPINIQVGIRTFENPGSIKQVARVLRIDYERVDEIWDWKLADTLEWLSQYPADVLKSLPIERKFEEWQKKQAQQKKS